MVPSMAWLGGWAVFVPVAWRATGEMVMLLMTTMMLDGWIG